jgi:osmotically-inducible protein OsmY
MLWRQSMTNDSPLTCRRYQTDSSIRASDVSVSAADSVVTLRGTVPDESAREHAISVARQVEGVRKVDDELQL